MTTDEIHTADSETTTDDIKSTDMGAAVYEYHGEGEDTDIVAAVKSHHAEEHNYAPSDLIGQKIAKGGNEPQVAYVAIVE